MMTLIEVLKQLIQVSNITIILTIFKKGLSLESNELFSFNSDKVGCLKVACVSFPNLNQKKTAKGIIIRIIRNSGSAK
jgi:hypothetical protein